MAPIKLEEQLKDKLEKRTLSPSSEGWSKLSQRLDAESNKSKISIIWWIGIAASLIIMIALSVQLFDTNDSDELLPQVVEQKVKEAQNVDEESKLIDIKSKVVAQDENKDEINKRSQPISKPQLLDYKKVSEKESKSESKRTELSNSDFKESSPEYDDEMLNEEVESLLNKVMAENAVTNTLDNINFNETTVTDKEIDSLLKKASKELFKDKLGKNYSKTVDAKLLLTDVEDEMGESFRSKVFEALNESFKTIKTTIAERNN